MIWEIPDSDIRLACENEFDGQNRFLLVQEILEGRKEAKQLKDIQFSPSGDNHHNAAMCPHCGDPVRKLQVELDKSVKLISRLKDTLTDVRSRVKEIKFKRPQESDPKLAICEDILSRIKEVLKS